MIRSGALTKKISIEEITGTARTSSGDVTETWAERSAPFAAIEPINGREYFAASQVQAENTVRFRIRYESGLTTKMRILYNTNYYDIHSIINAREGNDELILMAVEYVD